MTPTAANETFAARASAAPNQGHIDADACGVEKLYATGHWLLGEERFDDAAQVFRVMLQLAPADERGWLGLGECHRRADQPNIALELFAMGSAAAEPSPRCLVACARVLKALGRDSESDLAYERAAELASKSSDDELCHQVQVEMRSAS
jgi:tetratricopeptide (TPR) repeat protein